METEMKLTAERLKKLIKEQLSQLNEEMEEEAGEQLATAAMAAKEALLPLDSAISIVKEVYGKDELAGQGNM